MKVDILFPFKHWIFHLHLHYFLPNLNKFRRSKRLPNFSQTIQIFNLDNQATSDQISAHWKTINKYFLDLKKQLRGTKNAKTTALFQEFAHTIKALLNLVSKTNLILSHYRSSQIVWTTRLQVMRVLPYRVNCAFEIKGLNKTWQQTKNFGEWEIRVMVSSVPQQWTLLTNFDLWFPLLKIHHKQVFKEAQLSIKC